MGAFHLRVWLVGDELASLRSWVGDGANSAFWVPSASQHTNMEHCQCRSCAQLVFLRKSKTNSSSGLFSAIFLLIGVATFGGSYKMYFTHKEPALDFEGSCRLAWAFGVAVVSLLLTFASNMLMVLEMLMGGKDY